MPGEWRLSAPAKLNLRLKVVGRRPDGYHLLSMLNVSSSLCDELTVSFLNEPRVDIRVLYRGEVLTELSIDNSVARAWNEFWKEFPLSDRPLGVQVIIKKRIPVGAGLGGGSSDAGAVLRFLNQQFIGRLLKVHRLSTGEFNRRILEVALKVGADVPYAYIGGSCWVTGVGEVVRPICPPLVWPGELVILMPQVSVPTGDFYRFFRERNPNITPDLDLIMERFIAESAATDRVKENTAREEFPWLGLIENDFEPDIRAFRPEVGRALDLARSYFPHTTSVTGSGAAVFTLIAEDKQHLSREFCSALENSGILVERSSILA